MTPQTERVKPWMRERYLEWRKEYEKTPKYKERVRAYQAKRRADKTLKGVYAQYQRTYKNKNKLRVLIRYAIKRAHTKNITVDSAFLKTLTRQSHCECCDRELDYSGIGMGNQAPLRAPTLDRINNERGYVRGNVGIICWRCNVLKKDGCQEEFLAILKYMGTAR